MEIEKLGRDKSITDVEIPLYAPVDLGYDLAALASVLSELFLLALARTVRISFIARRAQGSLLPPDEEYSSEVACLFSGGVDSYAGILRASQTYDSVAGIFCAHSDQSKMIAAVRHLGPRLRRLGNVTLEEVRVPSLGKRGYVQLRGFLYIVAAGPAVAKSRAGTLLVTECGPTMFQPRFSPLDSVTMTTHPDIVRLAHKCLMVLLRREIGILTPHAHLTKAEVISQSPEKTGLRHTHSCITQRFGDHDGTCYGCVIRRLAATAAGIKDVRYRRNPLWDERANGGNLLELLRFSADLLISRDRLQDFQIRHVSAFNAWDLFYRFALDNFAAVRSINSRGGRLRRAIRSMLYDVTRTVGQAKLDRRLAELRR